MLELERVEAHFSLFSNLEGDALTPWKDFCLVGTRYVEGQLREDADVSSNMQMLCCYAAALAYGDYLAVQSAFGQSEEFRIGEISVKSAESKSGGNAEELRNHFRGRVAGLLRPDCPVLLSTGAAEVDA